MDGRPDPDPGGLLLKKGTRTMSYPIDQLTALTKANFDLALRLGGIARIGGQEMVQAGSKMTNGFAEDARAALLQATGKGGGTAAEAPGKVAAVLADQEQVRAHVLADTRTAVEDWQRAWQTAEGTSAGAMPGNAFADLFKPWLSYAPGGAKA
jgi:hypothetical protein